MSDTRIHGYARVSSKDQNADRQISALRDFGIADRDIYVDTISGHTNERPELERMLNAVRKGDLVVVLSIDRLGRDYNLIQDMWKKITKELQADIKVLDMPLLDTRTNGASIDSRFISDLVLQILSYVADKERKNIKARQAQGIALALQRGRKLGRPRAQFPEEWTTVYELWYTKKEITATEAMKRLGLKRNTFYKLAAEYEAKQS